MMKGDASMSREKPVRVVVLRTAGTNCDVETAYARMKAILLSERTRHRRVRELAEHLVAKRT